MATGMPPGGYQPKSRAGRLALYAFIAIIFITLLIVLITKA